MIYCNVCSANTGFADELGIPFLETRAKNTTIVEEALITKLELDWCIKDEKYKKRVNFIEVSYEMNTTRSKLVAQNTRAESDKKEEIVHKLK